MSIKLLFEIANLALSIVDSILDGVPSANRTAPTLELIVRKTAWAYFQQTGIPLDPSTIEIEGFI